MDIGCGIDDTAAAFAYRQGFAARSILSAGVVIDGIPYHHVMPMGPGEKYHKSKFGRTKAPAMFQRKPLSCEATSSS